MVVKHSPLLIAFGSLLIGCAPVNDEHDTSTTTMPDCESEQTAEVLGSVVWKKSEGLSAEYATVYASDGETTPLQIATDANGQFTGDLDVGPWTFSAIDQSHNCSASQPAVLTLEACATGEVEIVIDLCMG